MILASAECARTFTTRTCLEAALWKIPFQNSAWGLQAFAGCSRPLATPSTTERRVIRSLWYNAYILDQSGRYWKERRLPSPSTMAAAQTHLGILGLAGSRREPSTCPSPHVKVGSIIALLDSASPPTAGMTMLCNCAKALVQRGLDCKLAQASSTKSSISRVDRRTSRSGFGHLQAMWPQ